METSVPRPAARPDIPPFPDEALIAEMERIPEPAVLFLPGGRIAAINPATARLAGIRGTGMTVAEALDRYGAVRADGGSVIRGDLPCARALRGEVVDHGERLELTLPDGSVFRALVTSTPVVVDGRVVAALSVLHDFDAYVRGLASPSPPDADGPVDGR
jgi:PAS domain-containing protein